MILGENRKEVAMATNLRAYRDGNRLVVVIENPTKNLESLVASLLSGDINSVKDLGEPKPMAKPKVDVDHMEEVKPVKTASTPVSKPQPVPVQTEPPKAPFVKKIEQAAAASKSTEEKKEAQPAATNSAQPNIKETPHVVSKPEDVNRNVPASKPNVTNSAPATQMSVNREILLRQVTAKKNRPIIKNLLRRKYGDEYYDLKKLNTRELLALSKVE